MSGVFTIFIFFAVIALTAVLFTGWIAFVVLRAILCGVGSIFMPRRTWRTPAYMGWRGNGWRGGWGGGRGRGSGRWPGPPAGGL